jgi:hypothetical protein
LCPQVLEYLINGGIKWLSVSVSFVVRNIWYILIVLKMALVFVLKNAYGVFMVKFLSPSILVKEIQCGKMDLAENIIELTPLKFLGMSARIVEPRKR